MATRTFSTKQRNRLHKRGFTDDKFFDDRRLHVLAFPSGEKHQVGVFVGGRDRYGILDFITRLLLLHHGLEIIGCFGERLATFQGTCFDLEFSDVLGPDDFLSLQRSLAAELSEFKLDEPFLPEYVARLQIEVPHDEQALLLDVATVFRDLRVNLGFFRFDRFTDRAKKAMTTLSARCELPKGVTPAFLEKQLRAVCPADANMLPLKVLGDSSPALIQKEMANRKRLAANRN